MEIFSTPIAEIDGFGAQYQKIITNFIVIVCKYGMDSLHYNPITRMEHNYENSNDFIENIENLINLRENIHLVEQNKKYTQVAFTTICNEFERNIDYYCQSVPMNFIKKCFWENKDRDVFKNNAINVAVHIRRPNIHDNRIEGTNTPDIYYINIMNIIREKYKNNEILFHIYSQGNKNQFILFNNDNVVLHLNEDICKTFIEMVGADILITSGSSLSYVAALISDGEIYYKHFWHKPRKEWIICID
jgi:hypothetical protein|uniref:Glycosyltransferase n=1 Tax=viral metagenome TaxID=1070528 RepID=A0A6C0C3W7_9ZZZZ